MARRVAPVTINEDTTFLIADEAGNAPEGAELGLYHADTRFLCCHELRLDGVLPLVLAARATGHSGAVHFLTNPALASVPRGALAVVRRRLVWQGLHEDLEVTNYSDDAAEFDLLLTFDADFAHIFEVKRSIEVPKEAIRRRGEFRMDTVGAHRLRFTYRRDSLARALWVELAPAPLHIEETRHCLYRLRLAPRQRWTATIDVLPIVGETDVERPAPSRPRPHPEADQTRTRRRAALIEQAPRLESDSHPLQRAYERSIRDFAALRVKGEDVAQGAHIIVAGLPWFMALFGRDALLAAYQALPVYPEAAPGVLRALAALQGTRVDNEREEEPGKILHEHRFGPPAGAQDLIPGFPYYGSVDATPLFLMLAASYWRLTGDLEAARELRPAILRAIEWMQRYGDGDRDGYLEYIRKGTSGLENQGWKDSGDAIRFRDGRLAHPPIALCEVQGYAYAARMGIASLLDALGERERGSELRRAAEALRQRFVTDFWLPDRGYYALALDGEKARVDALASNAGHLLWTGIAPEEHAARVAQGLMAADFFTGWGIRTMAASEAAYNPIAYHNGSVWPHDTALAAAGLARYGFMEEAARVIDGLLDALTYAADSRLPELFAGYDRTQAPFPVEYPTASRLQAWASGSVFLLLSLMTGIDLDGLNADGLRPPALPPSVRTLTWDGVWIPPGRRVAITVERDPRGEVRRRVIDADPTGR